MTAAAVQVALRCGRVHVDVCGEDGHEVRVDLGVPDALTLADLLTLAAECREPVA